MWWSDNACRRVASETGRYNMSLQCRADEKDEWISSRLPLAHPNLFYLFILILYMKTLPFAWQHEVALPGFYFTMLSYHHCLGISGNKIYLVTINARLPIPKYPNAHHSTPSLILDGWLSWRQSAIDIISYRTTSFPLWSIFPSFSPLFSVISTVVRDVIARSTTVISFFSLWRSWRAPTWFTARWQIYGRITVSCALATTFIFTIWLVLITMMMRALLLWLALLSWLFALLFLPAAPFLFFWVWLALGLLPGSRSLAIILITAILWRRCICNFLLLLLTNFFKKRESMIRYTGI